MSDLFDRGRLCLDSFCVGDCERFSEALGTILARAWSSGEMERVDVVRSILFDHRDDVLTQAREQRSNRDRRHHADHDSEHREKTAKLMATHTIECHPHRLTQNAFWYFKLHYALLSARIGSSRAALNAG